LRDQIARNLGRIAEYEPEHAGWQARVMEGADQLHGAGRRLFRRLEDDRAEPGACSTLSQKAQQLVGGPTATAGVNGRPRLLVALDNDEIDLLIHYCSGAQQIVRDAKYKSVSLPPELMVGPEYGLTVSRKAQPAAAGFAMYLIAASAGDAEVVWLHSGGAARWAVAVHAWQASAPSLYGSGWSL
jgi:hypothetical protein